MSITTMRSLRGVLLVLALVAAIAVFVLGGRGEGEDWQVPALVLVGVIVLIIHAATSSVRSIEPSSRRSRETVPAGPSYEELHHHANPHHHADPALAERGGMPFGAVSAPTSLHGGLPDVVVPAASFPDAGHGHGPVIRVADDAPPPPLYAVIQPEPSAPPPAPQPAPLPAPPPPQTPPAAPSPQTPPPFG